MLSRKKMHYDILDYLKKKIALKIDIVIVCLVKKNILIMIAIKLI